jgi:N5-(cytidine 5'-diphosphoramidyl)-L-glutamine hydrolase
MRLNERPTVAVTLRVTQADGYIEPRDAISHDWIRRLEAWNMTPVLIPNVLREPVAYFDALAPDLLLLTGGDDPGATPERDALEDRLLAHAVARGRPVFGVCRGMQMINLHFGGRLCPVDGHVATAHPVALAQAWRGLYGEAVRVNSFHAQGIAPDALGDALTAVAADDQGRAEALVHVSRPVAGVMWHPERAGAPDADRQLVERLLTTGAFWA